MTDPFFEHIGRYDQVYSNRRRDPNTSTLGEWASRTDKRMRTYNDPDIASRQWAYAVLMVRKLGKFG